MSKKCGLPQHKELVLTEKGRNSVLRAEVKFPIRVRPADHLKDVMKADMAHPEKLFRVALAQKQYKFAKDLVDAKIVPHDTDLIYNCCANPSKESMAIVVDVLERGETLETGLWNRTLATGLHHLFYHKFFTREMHNVAVLLSGLCDINLYSFSHPFIQMLQKRVVSAEKVKILSSLGMDFSVSKHRFQTLSDEQTTISDYLTRGIDINEMIEILTIIRDCS